MDGKQWQPVGDGKATESVTVEGEWLVVASDAIGYEVGAKLPTDLRLCRLVDAPAWGPPMAQPDAPGWWAFEGDTPSDVNEQSLLELYWAEYEETGNLELCVDGGPGYFAGEMTGTWRKLTMPWEVTP